MKSLLSALRALSDETRLRIINLLFEKELCVCDIMETLKISQAKASRHLIYLKNAGLVLDRRKAQWVYYSLTKDNSNKFIESLVFDNLRKSELYLKDLGSLKQWLERKNETCE